MPQPLKKVAFTMYPVTDVPRARQFYEETLGLTAGLVGGEGEMHWVEYDLPGGGCMAISNYGDKQPGTSGGSVAFEVEDLEALIEELKAKSVSFVTELIHGPSCRMIVCLDSEGNSLILHQMNE